MDGLGEGKTVQLERVDSGGCKLEKNEVSGDDMDDSNEAASNNWGEEGEVGIAIAESLQLNAVETNRDGESAKFVTPLQSSPVTLDYSGMEIKVPPPKVGMVFTGWLEVEEYYRSYAKQVGFAISRVKAAYKAGKNKEKRSTTWRCECSGKPDTRKRIRNGTKSAKGLERSGVGLVPRMSDWVGIRAPRKSKKCECTAMVYASINTEGEWVVRKVVLEHKNHIPSPSQTNYKTQTELSSVTDIACVSKRLADDQDTVKSDLCTRQNLERERDGGEKPTAERDTQNVREKGRRLKLRDGDVNAMMRFIERMQKDDQNIFHSYRFDENGILKDVLWVDARCKAAYEEFGDVVYFDTVYLTNGYELPLANFVGVNHHGQTILLGCALLSYEDTETFEWVFRTWLLCMGGKAPLGMLTDDTNTIKKALSTVMPNTKHCWCVSHIIQKFGKELGRCDRYTHFKEELKNVIYDSFTVEEFQSQWLRVIENYDLQSSEWLSQMYKERKMWVPAYTKNLFWAGMGTTHGVESIRGFFDEYVGRHTSLCEFADKYCFAMEQQVSMEKDADINAAKYLRGLATGFKVEKVFQKMYTDVKFCEVQRECARVLYCTGRGETWLSETEVEHLMEDRVWVFCTTSKNEIPSAVRRVYRVQFNTETSEVSCDCKLFQSCGIMCRHSIKVYDMNMVEDVPEKYILRRWRKDIPRKHTRVKVAYHDPSKSVEVMRFDKMMSAFELLCGNAMQMEEATQIVVNMTRAMDISVNDCLGKISTSIVGECQTMDVSELTPSTGTLKFTGNSENPPAETASGTNVFKDLPASKKWHKKVQTFITEKDVHKTEELVSEVSMFEHDDDNDEDRSRMLGVMKKIKLDGVNCSQAIQVQRRASLGEFQGQQQEPTSLEAMQLEGEAGRATHFSRNIEQGEIVTIDDSNEHHMEPRSIRTTNIGGEGEPAAFFIRNIHTKEELLRWNRTPWE